MFIKVYYYYYSYFPHVLSWLFFVSVLSVSVKACLSRHNSVGYAVFVFVAASRNDRAPQCSTPVPLVVSLSHQLQKRKRRNGFSYAFASWRVYANYVYVCVSVSIHMFRNMCVDAKTFIILHRYSVL